MGVKQNPRSRSDVSGGPEQAPTAPPTSQSAGIPPNVDIRYLLNTPMRVSGLSTEATTYLDTIKKLTSESGLKFSIQRGDKFEMVLVSNADQEAICLVFYETYTGSAYEPPCLRRPEILQIARDAGTPGVTLSVVVTPDMYTRPQQMAMYLANCLISSKSPELQQLHANMFTSQNRLVIDGRMEEAMQFIRTYSPHTVPARADVAFTVKVTMPSDRDKVIGMRNFQQNEIMEEPVMAVTGYTEHIRVPAQARPGQPAPTAEFQILPIVIITDVVSIWPVRNILSIPIAVGADDYIHRRRWLSPYGFSDAEPNLGNVVSDEKGNPWFVRDQKGLIDLLNTFYMSPFFGFSIEDGRARIPGLESIGDPSGIHQFLESISTFTGSSFADVRQTTATAWPIYTGVCRMEGQMVDTRKIDYFRLTQMKADRQLTQNFLMAYTDPNRRIQDIVSVLNPPDLKVLYNGNIVIFDGGFINRVLLAMNNSRLPLEYKQQVTQIDVGIQSLAMSNANQFGGVGLGVGTSLGGVWTGSYLYR